MRSFKILKQVVYIVITIQWLRLWNSWRLDSSHERSYTGSGEVTDSSGKGVTLAEMSPLPSISGSQIQKLQDQNVTRNLKVDSKESCIKKGRKELKKWRINAKRIEKNKSEKIFEKYFPGHPNSSIVHAVDHLTLCHEENSSEDVRTLPHRTDTSDICPSCVEFGRSRELW
jgi:hypothetical protein